MALLSISRDGVEVRNIDLGQFHNKSEIVIGRAELADVRLDDRAIGRNHASLRLGPNGLVLRKLSAFGRLSVNGHELDASPTSQEVSVKEGDIVHLADFTLRLTEGVSVEAHPAALAGSSSVEESARIKRDPSLEIQNSMSSGLSQTEENTPIPSKEEGSISLIEENSSSSIPQSNSNEVSRSLDLVLDTTPSPIPRAIDSVEEVRSPDLSPFQQQESQHLSQSAEAKADTKFFSGEDQTKALDLQKIHVELHFKPGEANAQVVEIRKPETSIGRGSNCDVILSDKKASRKHAVILRRGALFFIRDLGSANGTYVNGELISEKDLQAEDILRIGDTEFKFRAVDSSFESEKQNLLEVSQKLSNEEISVHSSTFENNEKKFATNFSPHSIATGETQSPTDNFAASISLGSVMAGPSKGKKESLLSKFRKQPPVRRFLIMGLILGLVYYSFQEENLSQRSRKPASVAQEEKDNQPFNALPLEKRQFVLNTYQFAFDLYTQEKYEESLYEIRKIHKILTNGYKQSKDIEAYAQKAIEQLAEKAERKRKKEEEEKLQGEVATLVAQAESLVDQGKYDDARGVFSQILEKDPENPVVQRLKNSIDQKEQLARVEEEERKNKEAKRKSLQAVLDEGRKLLSEKKYYEAIDKAADANLIDYKDEGMLNQAKQISDEAHRRLEEDVKSYLEQGEKLINSGEFSKAREEFLKALAVDYKNEKAKSMIKSIQKTITERARKIYTEALIAEGISDFHGAKEKFRLCLNVATPGDLYHGRCERKYKRYDLLGRDIASTEEGQEKSNDSQE